MKDEVGWKMEKKKQRESREERREERRGEERSGTAAMALMFTKYLTSD